jgi:hypothetical protein
MTLKKNIRRISNPVSPKWNAAETLANRKHLSSWINNARKNDKVAVTLLYIWVRVQTNLLTDEYGE